MAEPILEIPTRAGPVKCVGGHGRLEWRASTFYTEEPETIQWLDRMGEKTILWDVGANVGLYSLYAAKVMGAQVIAFEPESQNFALLCRNIALNELNSQVIATPLAFGAKRGIDRFQVREISAGIAWSRLGNREPEHTFTQMASVEMMDRIELLPPTHVKIDVDGTERDVIEGARWMITHRRVESWLIELDASGVDGAAILRLMKHAGYRLASHARNANTKPTDLTENYIFERE